LLNTNADTMAAELALALAPPTGCRWYTASRRKGVLADPTDDDSVIPHISFGQ
jgi:acetylglutamate kinase